MKNFFSKTENFFNHIIVKTENCQSGPVAWLLTFFVVVFVRNLLETFSSRNDIFAAKNYYFFFLHSSFFYLYIFLALILFLYFLTKERIEKITKTALFISPLLLLPPLVDLLASRGAGVVNTYLVSRSAAGGFWETLWALLKYGTLGLFSSLASPVTSFLQSRNYGIRLEILFLAALIIFYVFLKRKNALRIFLSFFLFVPFIYLVASFPYWLQRLAGVRQLVYNVSSLNPEFTWHVLLFSLYFILSFLLASLWLFIYQKSKLLALLKNLRLSRTLQILAMLALGLYLGGILNVDLRFFDYLLLLTAALALILYWAWGVLSNDLADTAEDQINSANRPLPSGKISRAEAKTLSLIFLFASYIASLAVGYAFFIAVFLRSCLAYLYSFPPFRLKRIPFLSTLTLALTSLMTVLGGFLLIAQNSIYDFPPVMFLFIILALTLGFNAKDIKDYEGDRAAGVKTLPVIFGLSNGKKIIGILSLVCFLLPPIFFPAYRLILLGAGLVGGALSCYLINRARYREAPLLWLYFGYGAAVLGLVWW